MSQKISEGIFRIGMNITEKDYLFEGIWSIPNGVSLNAYLIKSDKNVLIDMVQDKESLPDQFIKECKDLLAGDKLDYLVLNHLEPDHSGALPKILEAFPSCRILCSKKAEGLVKSFFNLENPPLEVIGSGDSLDLGQGKELLFENIPNVHWPETIATYEKSTGILFSCDAFGSYGAISDKIFDDQLNEQEHLFFEDETERYYANIVSSFSSFVEKALEKLGSLDIKIIAPSHGIIWREDPARVIKRYQKLASYKKGPAEPEIALIWGSMYGNTKKAVDQVAKGIQDGGCKVRMHRMPDEPIGFALQSAWRCAGLAFGMPTYEYKMFPPIAWVLDLFERKHVQNRIVFRFGSFGWSGGAQREFEPNCEKFASEKLESLEWAGAPTSEDLAKAYEKGKELARKVLKFCKEDS